MALGLLATKAYDGEKVEYNKEYLEPNAERQTIEYDVGFNQTIRVNSTADECFKHGVGREVDDLLSAIQNVLDLEGVQATWPRRHMDPHRSAW